MVDGATPFQAFHRVILPLALPGLAATAVYIFLTAWDELLFAQVLTTEATATVPVGIRNFVGNYQNRYDLVMAAATVATLPVLVLFFFVQRQLIQGLTAGAGEGLGSWRRNAYDRERRKIPLGSGHQRLPD